MNNINNIISNQFDIETKDHIKINGLSNIHENISCHYLIYKIENLVNGKYYKGQHKTKNPLDNYMGSGDLIIKAEQKYGLSNFIKTILFDYDNFYDMNKKEQELVQISNCYPFDTMSYNIREGGSKQQNPISIQKNIQTQKRNCKNKGKNNPMYGHSYTEYMTPEAIEQLNIKRKINGLKLSNDKQFKYKMSLVTKGKNNPMYGHSCFEFMSEKQISIWKQKRSIATSKEKNPMFGKSSWEKCTEEQRKARIERYKNSMKGKTNKGKRCMSFPGDSHFKMVKKEDIQKYLDLGYVFYHKLSKLK